MRVERVFIGEKRGFVFETKTCDVRRHRIDQGCFEVDCIQAGSNPTGTYPKGPFSLSISFLILLFFG